MMTSFKHLNTGQKTKADPIHLYFTVWGLIHNRAFIPKNAEHFFPQDTIPDFNKNVLIGSYKNDTRSQADVLGFRKKP